MEIFTKRKVEALQTIDPVCSTKRRFIKYLPPEVLRIIFNFRRVLMLEDLYYNRRFYVSYIGMAFHSPISSTFEILEQNVKTANPKGFYIKKKKTDQPLTKPKIGPSIKVQRKKVTRECRITPWDRKPDEIKIVHKIRSYDSNGYTEVEKSFKNYNDALNWILLIFFSKETITMKVSTFNKF